MEGAVEGADRGGEIARPGDVSHRPDQTGQAQPPAVFDLLRVDVAAMSNGPRNCSAATVVQYEVDPFRIGPIQRQPMERGRGLMREQGCVGADQREGSRVQNDTFLRRERPDIGGSHVHRRAQARQRPLAEEGVEAVTVDPAAHEVRTFPQRR
ncbi:hypothetical protein J2X55_001298 [Microbacterium sp. 1154]|uniref:hypothetical protein n=1 Tax=Microbacterium sp. 1154 TaxID=2817733 RepID=UPI00285C9A40|nr:hypothetical protein [Microbacterium sp. 1154]MDR6690399.1 hypothetical protein [Microbacterium sp. 1154]